MSGMNRSKSLFQQAKHLFPGGVNSPVRAFKAVGGTPLFFQRGDGAYLFDEDGNRYTDFVCSWGPQILGHCHPQILEAIGQAIRHGTSFGAPSAHEIQLARQIREGLAGLDAAALASLIIAYEPVWAIGTGRTATPEMAEETQRAIRGFVAEQFGAAAAADLTIQYGGSMKPANAAALCAQADINGGLIGGAALKADSFAELVKNAIAGNGEK